MKKVIILIIIFGVLLGLQNYLQNFHNRAIIGKASVVNDPGLAGYISAWDNNNIYLLDENNQTEKVTIDSKTIYLRTYVDNKGSLLQQDNIELKDFVKDQYITIDVFHGGKELKPRALIVRQMIYVDEK